MDDERVKIIVREIEYWKENRLLPASQCDFLLNLYTKGEYEKIAKTSRNHSKTNGLAKLPLILHIVFLILLIPFSFIITYFTEISPFMQLVFMVIFLIYSIFTFVYFKRKNLQLDLLPLLISLFLFLLLSTQAGLFIFGEGVFLNIIVLLNMGLWLIVSRKIKSNILLFISVLGIIFTFLYIFM